MNFLNQLLPYFILFILLITSCKEDTKQVDDTSLQKMENINALLKNEPQKESQKFIALSDSLNQLAVQCDNPYFLAQSYNHKGNTELYLGNFVKSIDQFQHTLEIGINQNDNLLKVRGYFGIGNNFLYTGSYEKALNYYLSALKLITPALKSDPNNSKTYNAVHKALINNLAVIYTKIGENEKAINYYERLLVSDRNDEDSIGVLSSYVNLSTCYTGIEELYQAKKYIDSAKVLIQTIKAPDYFSTQVLIRSGEILMLEKDSIQACKIFEEALRFSQKIGNEYDISSEFICIAKTKKSPDSAIFFLNSALNIALELEDLHFQELGYELLHEKYKVKGEIDSSLQMMENLLEVRKKIENNKLDVVISINDYENEVENVEVKERGNKKIRSEKIKSYSILLFILVTFFVSIFFFVRKAKKLRKERLVLLNVIKELQLKVRIHSNTSENSFKTLIEKDKMKIEKTIDSKLNNSDWGILQTIYNYPTYTNREISKEVNLSVEGMKSSLRKMYRLFDIPSDRNMRLNLTIRLSEIIS